MSDTNNKGMSQYGIRFRPDILLPIYGQLLGSNLYFRKRENLLEGGELRIRPKHSSTSRYWAIVNSLGVLSRKNAYLVSQARQSNSQSCYLVPRLSVLHSYPYVVFVLYLVHPMLISSLVIGMHTLSFGLK